MRCPVIDTHIQHTSYKRFLVLIETDTASSFYVGVFNVEISCSYMALQLRVWNGCDDERNIPEDMLRD